MGGRWGAAGVLRCSLQNRPNPEREGGWSGVWEGRDEGLGVGRRTHCIALSTYF